MTITVDTTSMTSNVVFLVADSHSIHVPDSIVLDQPGLLAYMKLCLDSNKHLNMSIDLMTGNDPGTGPIKPTNVEEEGIPVSELIALTNSSISLDRLWEASCGEYVEGLLLGELANLLANHYDGRIVIGEWNSANNWLPARLEFKWNNANICWFDYKILREKADAIFKMNVFS